MARIERNGFLVIPELFSGEEIAQINAALEPLFAETSDANIREKTSGEVRTISTIAHLDGFLDLGLPELLTAEIILI